MAQAVSPHSNVAPLFTLVVGDVLSAANTTMEMKDPDYPLVGVILGQLVLCFGRTASGNAAGAMQDAVGLVLGLAVFWETTAMLALAYGVACTCGSVYSFTQLVNLLLQFKFGPSPYGMTRESLSRVVVLFAPVVSTAGVMVATRTFRRACSPCSPGEAYPLLQPSPSACSWSLWPPPPTPPPPPLCGHQRPPSGRTAGVGARLPSSGAGAGAAAARAANASRPFRAIFQAPVPRSPGPQPRPRSPRSPRAVGVAAGAGGGVAARDAPEEPGAVL
uniref:Uncharacterized protein n=1 Tax=Pyrodinium bahamense TaxID=73915 RepID=A0A7S0B6H6_9DINO